MKKWIVATLVISAFLYFLILPLGAKQVNTPKDGLPIDVTISYLDNTVTLNWAVADGAEQYYIYSQNDPYSEFALIDSTTSTTWNGNYTQSKKFFYVTAEVNRFVLIPAGTFQMGDSFSEGVTAERPVHSVTLNSFYMGKYEVTQAEWQSAMTGNTNGISATPSHPSYGIGDNHPVNQVSWYAILVFCNRKSMAEGLTPVYTINSSTNPANWGAVPTSSNATWDAAIWNWSANGYRLPSEAEWEYAARGGLSGQRFPNGATISHSTNGDTQATYNASMTYSYNVSPTTGYHPSYGASSAPVGSFPPNGYGLYDMSGNLLEFCWDRYSSSYYSSSPSSNPTGPTTGSYRVLRGGFWDYNAYYCRVAYRLSSDPSLSSAVIGFRLSRTP